MILNWVFSFRVYSIPQGKRLMCFVVVVFDEFQRKSLFQSYMYTHMLA